MEHLIMGICNIINACFGFPMWHSAKTDEILNKSDEEATKDDWRI
jgi:hypothetical protein